MLFVVEGIDGCGKSSVISGLRGILGEEKFSYLSDPGSTKFGRSLRDALKDGAVPLCRNAQLLAFTAARAQLADELIRPALEAGRHVVCDRYLLSTYAYQEVQPRTLLDLNSEFCYGILPDLNVVVEVSVEEALARMTSRPGGCTDRFDRDRELLSRVSGRYRSQFCQMFGKTVYVDGMKERQKVVNDVAGAILDRLQQGDGGQASR